MEYLVCLCLLVGAEPDSKMIANTRNLVDNEWSMSYRLADTNYVSPPQKGSSAAMTKMSGSRTQMLSLRPSDEWHTGTAWYLKMTVTVTRTTRQYYAGGQNLTSVKSSAEVSAEAYRGNYDIYSHATNSDVIEIVVGFTRKYTADTQVSLPAQEERTATTEYNLRWSVDQSFKPEGAELLLALDEGDTIPEEKLELSVDRGFFVNEYGREAVLRYEPYTLLEKIVGEGEVRKFRELKFAALGETIYLRKGDELKARIGNSPPPSFRFRDPAERWSSSAVATNATNDHKNESPIEALTDQANEAYGKREYERVIQLCTAVVAIEPRNMKVLRLRGDAYYSQADWVNAGRNYSAAIEIEPTAELHFYRGIAYQKVGYHDLAAKDYQESARLAPNEAKCRNAVAWLLATCPDDKVRNGEQAVAYANEACKLTGFKDGVYLDTLAAAYAEAADFARAVGIQTLAVELIKDDLKEECRSRLRLFEQGKPFRE